MEDQPVTRGRSIYVLDCHEIYRRGLESVLATLAGIDAVAGASSVAAAESDRRALGRADLMLIDAALAGAVQFVSHATRTQGRPVLAYVARGEQRLIRAVLDAGAAGLLAKDAMTPEVLAAALEAALAGSCVFSPDLLPLMLAEASTPAATRGAPAFLPTADSSAAAISPVAASSPAAATSPVAGSSSPAATSPIAPSSSPPTTRPPAAAPPLRAHGSPGERRTPAPSAPVPPSRHWRLTSREQAVLGLIAQGHATREVARELCYSERTIKNVIHDAVTKLEARSRSHAVACAVRHGLI